MDGNGKTMTISGEKVRFFRVRRSGPEAEIEDSVLSQLSSLFPVDNQRTWTAGSVPLGAGVPDIVFVSFRPEVYALSHVEMPKARLLAYLRAIPRARADTIADRLQQPVEILIQCLNDLVKVEIVIEDGGVYRLSDCWKDILPEITTIEVKVANWKRAVTQAARNRIFAHRSYIALPRNAAIRVKRESPFRLLGIGVLGVDNEGHVQVIRPARRHQPKVWDYYYKLAELTAKYVMGDSNAIHSRY